MSEVKLDCNKPLKSILSDHLNPKRIVTSAYQFIPAQFVLYSFTQKPLIEDDPLYFDQKTLHFQIPISLGIKPFLSNEKYSDAICLETDFFPSEFSGTLNIGSSRHSMIGDIQFKGNGNNRTSIRSDFLHSSGHASYEECLNEYFRYSVLAAFNSDLCSVLGIATFTYESQIYYCIVRRFNSFRLPTLLSYSLSDNEKHNLQSFLKVHLNLKDYQSSLSFIFKKLSALLANNIFQQALALDNFTVTGDLIDFDGIVLSRIGKNPAFYFTQKDHSVDLNLFLNDSITSHFIFYLKNVLKVMSQIYDEPPYSQREALAIIFKSIAIDNQLQLHILNYMESAPSTLEIQSITRTLGEYRLPSELFEYYRTNRKFEKSENGRNYYSLDIDKTQFAESNILLNLQTMTQMIYQSQSNDLLEFSITLSNNIHKLANKYHQHLKCETKIIHFNNLLSSLNSNNYFEQISCTLLTNDENNVDTQVEITLFPTLSHSFNGQFPLLSIYGLKNKRKWTLQNCWTHLDF